MSVVGCRMDRSLIGVSMPTPFSIVFALVSLGSFVLAQEPVQLNGPPQGQLLPAITERADRLTMKFGEGKRTAPIKLTKAPVLRTGDPSRNIDDGAMWLWLDGEQPVAALCVWVRRGVWYSENASLCDDALEATGWPGSSWQPPAAARKWLAADEAVADSPAARQRTMREISRQFTASEDYRGQTFQLRLLPTPLFIYKSPDRGIIDGALFTVVNGNDPEVLIQIEARVVGEARRWQVAFERLSSAELHVRRGEKEVWSAPAPERGKPQFNTSYFTVREAEAKKR